MTFDFEITVKNEQTLCHVILTDGDDTITDVFATGELKCFLSLMDAYFDDDEIFDFVGEIRKKGLTL